MTVNRERKMVGMEMTTLSFEYCTLEDVQRQVNEMVESYGKDAYIDRHCYAYEDREYDFVMMKVPETDNEMAKRIAQEEKWEKDSQDRERENYERLSKIYGEKK